MTVARRRRRVSDVGCRCPAVRVTPVVHDRCMSNEPTVTAIEIACDTCVMEHSSHCQDCVVTFLCDEQRAPTQAVVFDLAEQRAVRLLAAAGMVPTLKHREAI